MTNHIQMDTKICNIIISFIVRIGHSLVFLDLENLFSSEEPLLAPFTITKMESFHKQMNYGKQNGATASAWPCSATSWLIHLRESNNATQLPNVNNVIKFYRYNRGPR